MNSNIYDSDSNSDYEEYLFQFPFLKSTNEDSDLYFDTSYSSIKYYYLINPFLNSFSK